MPRTVDVGQAQKADQHEIITNMKLPEVTEEHVSTKDHTPQASNATTPSSSSSWSHGGDVQRAFVQQTNGYAPLAMPPRPKGKLEDRSATPIRALALQLDAKLPERAITPTRVIVPVVEK